MLSCSRGKSPAQLFRYLRPSGLRAFNPKAPRPLKIGIHHDIRVLDGELSDDELRRALLAYTKMAKYLARLDAGAARVNLDGKAGRRGLGCGRRDRQGFALLPQGQTKGQANAGAKGRASSATQTKTEANRRVQGEEYGRQPDRHNR